MSNDKAFKSLCAHFGITAETPDEALTELSERMNKASKDISILMHFMREEGVSVYRLSQSSNLSVSAVKNRLGNREAAEEMEQIVAQGKDRDLALIDLSQLSAETRAEIEKAQTKENDQ